MASHTIWYATYTISCDSLNDQPIIEYYRRLLLEVLYANDISDDDEIERLWEKKKIY